MGIRLKTLNAVKAFSGMAVPFALVSGRGLKEFHQGVGRLAPAQTRASTTSPETQASDRERYIVTFLRARNFWRRFIGQRWKSSHQRYNTSLKKCHRSRHYRA